MEQKDPTPLFSLILTVPKHRSHLLSVTLETLREQIGASCEIRLLDGEREGASEKLYPQLPLRVIRKTSQNFTERLNHGISCACGRYIQFLEAGDRYLSPFTLSDLTEEVQKQDHPTEIIYGKTLQKNPAQPPCVVPFSLT